MNVLQKTLIEVTLINYVKNMMIKGILIYITDYFKTYVLNKYSPSSNSDEGFNIHVHNFSNSLYLRKISTDTSYSSDQIYRI